MVGVLGFGESEELCLSISTILVDERLFVEDVDSKFVEVRSGVLLVLWLDVLEDFRRRWRGLSWGFVPSDPAPSSLSLILEGMVTNVHTVDDQSDTQRANLSWRCVCFGERWQHAKPQSCTALERHTRLHVA